jgi:hypothetical protein
MERLYEIIEYNMTDDEAKAFKLAIIYEELAKKFFPKEQCGKLSKRGDPRKCTLFKYCYKMINENKNKLLDEQLGLFVKAQFTILKNIKDSNTKIHANVSPQVIVGKKAWNRWLVWLKKYKTMSQVQQAKEMNASEAKVIAKLKKTKEFLLKQLKDPPNQEEFCKILAGRAMPRWISLGKVSQYYILLSPWVAECCDDLADTFAFDISMYKPHITPLIEEHFKKEFDYEF